MRRMSTSLIQLDSLTFCCSLWAFRLIATHLVIKIVYVDSHVIVHSLNWFEFSELMHWMFSKLTSWDPQIGFLEVKRIQFRRCSLRFIRERLKKRPTPTKVGTWLVKKFCAYIHLCLCPKTVQASDENEHPSKGPRRMGFPDVFPGVQQILRKFLRICSLRHFSQKFSGEKCPLTFSLMRFPGKW